MPSRNACPKRGSAQLSSARSLPAPLNAATPGGEAFRRIMNPTYAGKNEEANPSLEEGL